MSRCSLLVDFAVACLKLFVMENWSGPCLKEEQLPECITALCTEVIRHINYTGVLYKGGDINKD